MNPVRRRSIKRVQQRLIKWGDTRGREFPWRNPPFHIYTVVITEILLQQTRAETVEKNWERILAEFPTWASLAAAESGTLEAALKPLGLWRRRASSLRMLATTVIQEYGGVFPSSRDIIEQLPGVGQYVANAVELFCYGRPRPLLDVNMARIIERYYRARDLADIRYDPFLQATAASLVTDTDPIAANFAILDLGAEVCRPKNPACTSCPLRNGCNFFRTRSATLRS